MEWINIKDNPPEINDPVLLLTDSGVIEGSRDKSEVVDWYFIRLEIHGCGCCGNDSDKVTHWMPLPEPPK